MKSATARTPSSRRALPGNTELIQGMAEYEEQQSCERSSVVTVRVLEDGNQLKIKQGAKLMAISWLTTPWADIELDSRTRRGCDMLGWA